MVTDGTQVKVLAWYDNEWGYANRLVELARTVAKSLPRAHPSAWPCRWRVAPPSSPRGDLRNYALVTGAYWTDTLVDGATRTLVLFYFDRLGYTPLQVASLFVLYEVAGVVTNLVGGFLAARWGLKVTLFMGLAVQIVALLMLGFAPASLLVVPYVMASQALSGIAKDLTKMSSKSAVKLVVPEGDQSALYRWVAILTGSKNALKGVGFFLGALLLTVTGFSTAALILAAMTLVALVRDVAADARASRQTRQGGEVQADVQQQPRGQRARRRAHLLVRRARRLVRRRAAVLPLRRARLVLLGGGRAARGLGDRLRRCPGRGAALCAPSRGRRGSRAGRADSAGLALLLALCPAAIAIALGAHVDGTAGDHRRPGPVRRGVRHELSGPLLPHPRLLGQRQGRDERRLLLHGQRVRHGLPARCCPG